MNKLLIDSEYIKLKDQEVSLEITKKNITIDILGNVKINDLISKEDINLIINLNDNSKLIFNKYNKDLSSSNVEINVLNNTYLSFNQSVYNTLKGDFKIFVNIKGSNNKTYVNFYGVTNLGGKIKVNATGDVIKDIKNNEMLENVRILTLNDAENIIYPNLLIASDEVEINHNATIAKVDEDELFYLNSKGLSKEEASNLIVKGFILNKLDINDEDKENIKL